MVNQPPGATVALNALPQEVTAMTSTPPLTQIRLLPPVRDYGTATVQMIYDYIKGRYTPPPGHFSRRTSAALQFALTFLSRLAALHLLPWSRLLIFRAWHCAC